jgi:hypothetical protein
MLLGVLPLSHLLGALSPSHALLAPFPAHLALFLPRSGAAFHYDSSTFHAVSVKGFPFLIPFQADGIP